nr:hypothetical protein [Tanacetum cinerariifolium]
CLVITDDYNRFTWVFFLATKDKTTPILKTFVTGLENQLSLKVKGEYSVPRTPQQNGIVERKNRTLIEAAKTMLVDSLLPIPFWPEAVNTACYVQNRETLHVNFLENKPNVAGVGPTWLFDIDSLSETMNYHPSAGSTNPQDNDKDVLVDGKEHGVDIQKSVSADIHFSSSSAQTRKQADKTECEDKDAAKLKLKLLMINVAAASSEEITK